MAYKRKERLNNSIEAVTEALKKHQDKPKSAEQLVRIQKLINRIVSRQSK